MKANSISRSLDGKLAVAKFPMTNAVNIRLIAALAFGASLAACQTSPSLRQYDTGNMAYPAPLRQGAVATTAVSSRAPADTGNMAFPAPLPQGDIRSGVTAPAQLDTGNMAYPAPVPSGEVSRTVVR